MNDINNFMMLHHFQHLAYHVSHSEIATLVLRFLGISLPAGLGAYFGAYLKRMGDNFATKEDFRDILAQLKTSTELTEEIKQQNALRTSRGENYIMAKQKAYSEALDIIFRLLASREWTSDTVPRDRKISDVERPKEDEIFRVLFFRRTPARHLAARTSTGNRIFDAPPTYI